MSTPSTAAGSKSGGQEGIGHVDRLIAPGEMLMSRTGRIMATFPARGGVTGRQMRADDRRIHAWLISEALAEIAVEPFYAHLASVVRRLDPRRMIGSDRDTLCLILFDDPEGPGLRNRKT